MNQFERTLEALSSTTRAGFDAKMEVIAFLRHYKWEKLSPKQLLEVLKLIHEDIKQEE